MKNKKFASFLAAAAALVLLAMPAFAADEQTELPAAEAAEVQQEQTAAPAEQETALPADAQTAGEPEQQLTYVALGDSITSGGRPCRYEIQHRPDRLRSAAEL